MKDIWNKLVLLFYTITIGITFSLRSFNVKGRATHKYGVGGIGHLTVIDDPNFPEHDFWKPGRTFPVQIRHGQVGFEDDASMDGRSASLKLSDQSVESPLDIVMNTGPRTFRDVYSFWKFSMASSTGKQGDEPVSSKGREAYFKKDPAFMQTFIEVVRRAPDTFSQMYYHSKLVNYFKAKDGKLRYVKYRLVPQDRGVDSGIISSSDAEAPWLQKRLPEEERPIDYLRQEYLNRLSSGPVIYHLQLRLHEDISGDKKEIFTQEREWDERSSPWLDLATVTIERPLSPEETENLSFNIGRQPDTLGIVEGYSIHDPNSVNYVRTKVYDLSHWIRELVYFFRGGAVIN